MDDKYLMKDDFVGYLVSKRGLAQEKALLEYDKLVKHFFGSLLLVSVGKLSEEVRKELIGGKDLADEKNAKEFLRKAKEYLEKNKVLLVPKDYAQAVALAYQSYDEAGGER